MEANIAENIEQISTEQAYWDELKKAAELSDIQVEQFKNYASLILEWNESMNLTAIREIPGIIKRHFMDSLEVAKHIDFLKIGMVVDIGSGVGAPGIPLKIKFPKLKVILIEVNKKRQNFLKAVIESLGLTDIEVCSFDFRTFIRTTEAKVDLFLARASLNLTELCRLFKPGCGYKNSKLVYWTSEEFEIPAKIVNLVKHVYPYKNAKKARKLLYLATHFD